MLKFLLIFIGFLAVFQNVGARQYKEIYLLDIIEANDCEKVGDFFDSHPQYVKKTKHILEFVEISRREMGIRFGYIPT